jgi:hypothetical protein
MFRRIGTLICLSMVALVLLGCGEGAGGEIAPARPSEVGGKTTRIEPGEDVPSSQTSEIGSGSAPVEEFSISSSHRTTPKDVLREIAFYAMGGGTEGWICDGYYPKPTLIAFPEGVELGDEIELPVCGWEPNESVRVTVRLPNGEETSEEVKAEEDCEAYSTHFWYSTKLDDPPGSYTFILRGDSGTLQYSVYVPRPAEARLCRDGNRLLLCAFEPNERVRVLAYEDIGHLPGVAASTVGVLAGWQEYRVDSRGDLVIRVEGDYTYTIVGDVSGDVHPLGGAFSGTLSFSVEASAGSTAVSVREGPGYDQRVVKQVASGARMMVTGLNRFVSEDTWLPIALSDGTAGWVPEVDVRRVGVSPSSSDKESSGCPGAPPQRVRVGGEAQVCTAYDRLVVRVGPGRSNAEVARIEPGTYVTVISGPACGDGWSWWEVRTDSGVVGWVAEGGDEVDPYFICPAR